LRAAFIARRNLRSPALRLAARGLGTLGAVAAKRFQPDIEIDMIAAETALGEHGRDLGRGAARTQTMGIDDHSRQPRRQCQRPQAPALVGDAAFCVECAEFAQEFPRFVQRRRGRGIEKGQLGGIADPPLREVKHQRRQIRAQDFRLCIGGKRCGLRFVP
jgi:hypothetical protein